MIVRSSSKGIADSNIQGLTKFDLEIKAMSKLFFKFQLRKKAPPTDDEKANAEKLKLEGNELMKAEKFMDAIAKYTE